MPCCARSLSLSLVSHAMLRLLSLPPPSAASNSTNLDAEFDDTELAGFANMTHNPSPLHSSSSNTKDEESQEFVASTEGMHPI